ncbi:restriction endonuclease [Rhizobium ruizarguesonis]
MSKRLPSFNDFSPVILCNDIRLCLAVVRDNPDDAAIAQEWARIFFDGTLNKRATTNIPATLSSTKLSTGKRPLELSNFGKEVLSAPSPREAAQVFCKGLLAGGGDNWLLIDALMNLEKKKQLVTKVSLKAELASLGVSLSTGTTDHTTFKNWLIAAELAHPNGYIRADEIKRVVGGIGPNERDEFLSLSLAQQVFLQELRKEHEVSQPPFYVSTLVTRCLSNHAYLFDEDQFAKDVRKPLADAGWIEVTGLAVGKQGGRSGNVQGTKKLLDIPLDDIHPDFDQVVPSELRSKLQIPLSDISVDLFGADKHKAGLALELLSLRMILDLGLSPRHFRLRSSQTAYAEVDLIAEGAHLLFSRWTFQCKRYGGAEKATKVGLSEVAKEVGIAVFSRAHVIVMVTTSDFSKDARNYAAEVSRATPLQFVFIDGKVLKEYLKKGSQTLHAHFHSSATDVMSLKRSQPLPSA